MKLLKSQVDFDYVPSAVGLLKKDFCITPERHKEISKELPFIDLYIHYKCSHLCVYCCTCMQKSQEGQNVLLENMGREQYLEYMLNLSKGKKSEYCFAGIGECAEMKDFPYFVQGILDAGHQVCIQTHGLSSLRIEKALEKYDKEFLWENVKFNLSFHFGTYLHDKNDYRLKKYLDEHLPRILKIGKSVVIVVPMSPNLLFNENTEKYFGYIKDLAAKKGNNLTFLLEPLGGPYEEHIYPCDYSKEELSRLYELVRKYSYAGPWFEGLKDEELQLINPLYLRGVPCYIFSNLARLDCCGINIACSNASSHIDSDEKKIYMNKFSEKAEALPCPYDHCGSFRLALKYCLAPHGINGLDYINEVYPKEKYERYMEIVSCNNSEPEKKMERLMYAFVQERIKHLIAKEGKIGVFPCGKHSDWLIWVIKDVIPADKIIFFDDSLKEPYIQYGYQCLPSNMIESTGIKKAVLSTDVDNRKLLERSKLLFAEVFDLYEGLPYGPYISKKYIIPIKN